MVANAELYEVLAPVLGRLRDLVKRRPEPHSLPVRPVLAALVHEALALAREFDRCAVPNAGAMLLDAAGAPHFMARVLDALHDEAVDLRAAYECIQGMDDADELLLLNAGDLCALCDGAPLLDRVVVMLTLMLSPVAPRVEVHSDATYTTHTPLLPLVKHQNRVMHYLPMDDTLVHAGPAACMLAVGLLGAAGLSHTTCSALVSNRQSTHLGAKMLRAFDSLKASGGASYDLFVSVVWATMCGPPGGAGEAMFKALSRADFARVVHLHRSSPFRCVLTNACLKEGYFVPDVQEWLDKL